MSSHVTDHHYWVLKQINLTLIVLLILSLAVSPSVLFFSACETRENGNI